jgi:hypothetical protein
MQFDIGISLRASIARHHCRKTGRGAIEISASKQEMISTSDRTTDLRDGDTGFAVHGPAPP